MRGRAGFLLCFYVLRVFMYFMYFMCLRCYLLFSCRKIEISLSHTKSSVTSKSEDFDDDADGDSYVASSSQLDCHHHHHNIILKDHHQNIRIVKMTGEILEVYSDKSLTLLTFDI